MQCTGASLQGHKAAQPRTLEGKEKQQFGGASVVATSFNYFNTKITEGFQAAF